jgi:hypothetical protein
MPSCYGQGHKRTEREMTMTQLEVNLRVITMLVIFIAPHLLSSKGLSNHTKAHKFAFGGHKSDY